MKTLLLIVSVVSTICSCAPSYQRCKNLYGGDSLVTFKDTTVIIYDTVYVQADTVSGEVSLEDLLTNDYVNETPKQKTNIGVTNGKLQYRNICKPDTFYIRKKYKYTYVITKTQTFKDQSVAQKVYSSVKWWWWVILVAMIFAFGYLIRAFKIQESL